jgi:outer membrane biosynthesis protein TonB
MSDRNQNPDRATHDPRRPGRGPVLASFALHVVLLVVTWILQQGVRDVVEYDTYQVEIVTMGDPAEFEAAAPEPPVVAPAQEILPEPEAEPEPPPPDPEPDVVPEPEPEVRREPEPEPPPAPRPETPPVVEQPPVTAETSTAEMNVRMEGLQRDFPEYYARITARIDACFRPTGSPAGTVVLRFEIRDDGTISSSSIRVHSRSGNLTLDIQAVGAVECAGRGQLGPLPDDLNSEVLPVQFTFSPGRGPGG